MVIERLVYDCYCNACGKNMWYGHHRGNSGERLATEHFSMQVDLCVECGAAVREQFAARPSW